MDQNSVLLCPQTRVHETQQSIYKGQHSMLNLQDHRRIPHWQLALAVLQALMTPPKLQPFVKESPWWRSSNAEQPIISYLNRWPTATPFLPTYYTSCPGKHTFVSKRWLSWGDLSFLGQLGSECVSDGPHSGISSFRPTGQAWCWGLVISLLPVEWAMQIQPTASSVYGCCLGLGTCHNP